MIPRAPLRRLGWWHKVGGRGQYTACCTASSTLGRVGRLVGTQRVALRRLAVARMCVIWRRRVAGRAPRVCQAGVESVARGSTAAHMKGQGQNCSRRADFSTLALRCRSRWWRDLHGSVIARLTCCRRLNERAHTRAGKRTPLLHRGPVSFFPGMRIIFSRTHSHAFSAFCILSA